MNIKDNKGITLIVLVVTIVVLLIIAGVTITAGTESIKRAKLETLRTNMLLIKAKGKEYCEEANFRAGIINESDTAEAKAEKIQKGINFLSTDKNLPSAEVSELPVQLEAEETYDYVAKLDTEAPNNGVLKELGLNEVANSENAGIFYIGFDIKNNKVEVFNSRGYASKDGTTYYRLTQIENLEE